MGRGSGILLHISSLPSAWGTGDFGKSGYEFADYLNRCGQQYWQILPLNPTSGDSFYSPYSSSSVFALNPLFSDPGDLSARGLIDPQSDEYLDSQSADFRNAEKVKRDMIDQAYTRFSPSADTGYNDFCKHNSWWLDDYALFSTIKSRISPLPWTSWPTELKFRKDSTLNKVATDFSEDISREKFMQYLLFNQWLALKNYCNQKGIKVIGDLPIYPSLDSAEVWATPDIFRLDGDRRPLFLAGVPPDYFSPTGQLWGNPVYDWEQLNRSGYQWWIDRLKHNFMLFDLTRIDHFRGLVAYWEVPFGEKDAVKGRWVTAPSRHFLDTLTMHFGSLPIIAEDLGLITDDVKRVLKKYGFPNMKVLLFAFSEDNHPYLPHHYSRNCLVYTGTHDNDTSVGWFTSRATPEEKERIRRYTGKDITPANIHWELIRLAMASIADTSIIPMQDILGLGNEARINFPSTTGNNWKWRLRPSYQEDTMASEKLTEFTRTYGRIHF